MLTSVSFAVSGVARYGVIIAADALNTLLMSELVTAVDCATRSDSVRDTIVTLRSIATPLESSTMPKYMVSIIGVISANSTAAAPRESRAKCLIRKLLRLIIPDLVLTYACPVGQTLVRFVAERRRRGHHPVVAV